MSSVIQQITAAVISFYVDGLPPHCHSEKEIKSVFKILSQDDFDSFSDKAMQSIFQDQHIVVHNPNQKGLEFGQALRGAWRRQRPYCYDTRFF